MTPLPLIYGPDPIFSQIALPVTSFDTDLATLTQRMIATLYQEQAVGLGANMVGSLQRIIVIDLQDNGNRTPQIFINPKITGKSAEKQCFEEGSVCFPGISAEITRAKSLTLTYQDIRGQILTLEADGYLATVIQHELDYLDGVIFLDHLSTIKRKMLLRKTQKFQKQQGRA
ncbi:peptide deformylase [Paremcibacter congregatus]|uniref:peptide deformylase n=1 Tax=Paremcibacter congregatus TaxID=2043170 RepID=UPI0030EB5B4D|tara:strand:+ start:1857 stop:2372 length:516 start_codon:yes stop_codon:yes gene_type:complete